jgi:hypothetical protein
MRTPEHLTDWDEFEARLRGLYEQRDARRVATRQHISPLLFRGQANAEWPLSSTLERYATQNDRPALLEADLYYGRIHAAKPEIETYTGRHWDLESPYDYLQRMQSEGEGFIHRWFAGRAYEYMVFLRHHGFPSPLLDWSRSPYVAAFFAFASAQPNVDRVAIYAFLEYAGQGKTGSPTTPAITGLGPYVPAHKRHFIQQSQYTVCTSRAENVRCYTSHQTAFENSETGQDILWQFTLPTTERVKVLSILDKHNINASSLFGSDEGLMETIAFRQLVLRED